MSTLYIRTLKRAEHTVFCVEKGQKTYYDPQFGRSIPYSSGQQIKHSLIDALSKALGVVPSPTTFYFDVTAKKEIKEGEVHATCNPIYPDQLFGGWMKAAKVNKEKTDKDKDLEKVGRERTIKRRSPLSISAMRGLHPLLAVVNFEDISFDRSDRPNNEVIVRDEKGKILNTEQITELLIGKDQSLNRKWIKADTKENKNARAIGLFVQDIALDLRRLFCVALNPLEPEISKEVEAKLKEENWIESENVFGKCLVAPEVTRKKLIPALAKAIVNWSISSNQSRTFSLMETLAIAFSENANKIAGSIRAKLREEDDKKVDPIVEESLEGVKTFVTLAAGGFIRTKGETFDALDKAEQYIIDYLNSYDYVNQKYLD